MKAGFAGRLQLSDLLKVTKLTAELLRPLAPSKTQFDKKTGPLINIRNAAMHPVRSLIRAHGDVAGLLAHLNDLRELIQKTTNGSAPGA